MDDWDAWLRRQRRRKIAIDDAIGQLAAQDRRWLARHSFDHNEIDWGIAAYRAYLADPGDIGPFANETSVYLRALLNRGEGALVLEVVDALEEQYGIEPELTIVAADAHLALGQQVAADERLAAARVKYADDGNLWAMSAIVAADPAPLQIGVRFPISEKLATRAEKALGLRSGAVAEMQQPFAAPDDDVRRWCADPGAHLRRAETSPHRFGGEQLAMPSCHGCGHRIRQFVDLNVAAEPRLLSIVPLFETFPLLGCTDCMMWMGRHDYVIDGRSVQLLAVALSEQQYGRAYETAEPLAAVPVSLHWRAPIDPEADVWPPDAPQVLGTPWWVQSPLRVFCRGCHGEMVFVAAMGTSQELGSYVAVTNESGFLYHFACNACRAVSVVAQWT
jgi:hypothetical protein